jgi:hypothetical protein
MAHALLLDTPQQKQQSVLPAETGDFGKLAVQRRCQNAVINGN